MVSPVNYSVCTAGKQDNSVRIWQPEDSACPEITFVPKQKAIVDGTIYSLNMSSDGQLMAAGCSLKNTVNGYVVIWNLKDNGNMLCNLRSRYIQRFGLVSYILSLNFFFVYICFCGSFFFFEFIEFFSLPLNLLKLKKTK